MRTGVALLSHSIAIAITFHDIGRDRLFVILEMEPVGFDSHANVSERCWIA
jgi:hypothetical protein